MFGYSLRQKESAKIKKVMKVPGQHNVSNALAVLAVCRQLGIDDKVVLAALSEFKGTWRRFELKDGEAFGKKITVISDYGHHPSEIMATLKAVREKFPNKKVWCVFQPHQHQRTHYLFNDFVKTFRVAKIDKIILTDIYDVAGREVESINKNTSSEKLAGKIKKKNVGYMPMGELEKFIKENIRKGSRRHI